MGRPVVHFEIGCDNSTKTTAFYSDMFDWKVTKNGPSLDVDTGSKEGIPGHIASLGHEPRHYITFYVDVEEIKPYLDKVTKLGGRVIVPAIKIPSGHFAWIADPEGNVIGLLQKEDREKVPGKRDE